MRRLIYVPQRENPVTWPERLEVLDVPPDDNGERPARKVYDRTLVNKPDQIYWVLVNEQHLRLWYTPEQQPTQQESDTPT